MDRRKPAPNKRRNRKIIATNLNPPSKRTSSATDCVLVKYTLHKFSHDGDMEFLSFFSVFLLKGIGTMCVSVVQRSVQPGLDHDRIARTLRAQICGPDEAKHKAGPAGRLNSCKSVKLVLSMSKYRWLKARKIHTEAHYVFLMEQGGCFTRKILVVTSPETP